MDEMFIKKVRAAAVAGWWTALIAYCVLLIQWVAYLLIMNRQPAGMACLWGTGMTWQEMQSLWLWAMAIYKLCIAMMIFAALWLTLWARQLKRQK